MPLIDSLVKTGKSSKNKNPWYSHATIVKICCWFLKGYAKVTYYTYA